MKVYVVEMIRNNNPPKQSYIIGVFSTIERAKFVGDAAISWRAAKYVPRITEYEFDDIPEAMLDYCGSTT